MCYLIRCCSYFGSRLSFPQVGVDLPVKGAGISLTVERTVTLPDTL